jgi:NitT/TauT family transport system permease protein
MAARSVLLPVGAFLVCLVAWEAIVRGFDIPSYLVPPPSLIAQEAYGLAGLYALHAGATLQTIAIGFMLAALVAIPLGAMIACNRLVSDAFYPLIVFSHAIPVIAIAPIIVVVFGTGMASRLVVVVLIAFFPIMVSTATGLLETPQDMLELGAVTGTSRLQLLRWIEMPYAVPFIFNGLRIGITAAVVGAVVGEFVSADRGLGYLVIHNTTNFNVPRAMAAVIILATISVILYQLVGYGQRLLFGWSVPARTRHGGSRAT